MSAMRLPAGAPAALVTLLADFVAGRKAALARAVSIVENHREGHEQWLSACHPLLGRSRRIGITGPPGAGKSTLTTLLAESYLGAGMTVGIVAVDPTSPFTGGALLGDRMRMERVALHPNVFIRSLATRGSFGGLAATTRVVCDVLDAFGTDRILVETVGVGQSELDIARLADTSTVVLVPESGDSIQTLKAGVMEIADLFVVNKADRPGADRLRNDIELMLGLRSGATLRDVPAHHGVDLKHVNPKRVAREAAAKDDGEHWMPPVLRTIGATGEGVAELVTTLDRHFAYLERSGTLHARRRARLPRTRGRCRRTPGAPSALARRIRAGVAGGAAPRARARGDDAVGRGRPAARAQRTGRDPHREHLMTSIPDLDPTVAAMQQELEQLRAEVTQWRSRFEKGEKRDIAYTNSESEVAGLYTAMDLEGSGGTAFEVPGVYPFTRGIHPTDVPRAPVDDAAVRGLRLGRRPTSASSSC
jgi:LAO/AO transport system kinase